MKDKVVLSKTLRSLQDGDKDITTVKELLVHNTKRTKDVAVQSLTVKSLCSQLNKFVIKDDVSYSRWTDLVSGQDVLQAIVPTSERRTVLKHHHDCRTAGHLGINKTLAPIRKSYYWPGLQKRCTLLLC